MRISNRIAPWLVVAVHAALVARFVSIQDWLHPIVSGDYSLHFYEALHAAEHFRRSSSLWAYDPYWMAGYPDGLVALIDNKLLALALALVPAGVQALVFNAGVVATLLSVPVLGYLSGRLAYGSRPEATFVALAGVAAAFTVPMVVFYWVGGGISFLLASILVVPVALGLEKVLEEESGLSPRGLGWIAAATLLVAIHPVIVLALGGGLLPLALARGSRGRLLVSPATLAALGILAVALLLALLPPLAVARFVGRIGAERTIGWWTAADFLQGGWPRLWQDWGGGLLRTRAGWTGGAGGLVGLVLLALAARERAIDRVDAAPIPRGVRLAPWSAAGVCFLLAYGSSWIAPLRFVQPYRFLVPLAFFLCVPAGRGAVLWCRSLRARSLGAAAGLAIVAAILVEGGWAAKDAVVATVEDETEARVAAFFEQLPRDPGRLLVESLWTNVPAVPDGSVRTTVKRFVLLPLRIDRECIGYQGTAALSAHRYAAFGYGRALGRDLAASSEADLESLLHRYAVSWVVACSAPSRRALARFGGVLERVQAVEECEILRVRRPEPSRLLEGSGRAEAKLDRIDVHDAAGERIVLKYHWVPGLRAVPAIGLEEVRQPGAAVGFIAVRPGGVREFSIVPGG